MASKNYVFDHHLEKYVKRDTRESIDYDNFTTRQWQILIAFF